MSWFSKLKSVASKAIQSIKEAAKNPPPGVNVQSALDYVLGRQTRTRPPPPPPPPPRIPLPRRPRPKHYINGVYAVRVNDLNVQYKRFTLDGNQGVQQWHYNSIELDVPVNDETGYPTQKQANDRLRSEIGHKLENQNYNGLIWERLKELHTVYQYRELVGFEFRSFDILGKTTVNEVNAIDVNHPEMINIHHFNSSNQVCDYHFIPDLTLNPNSLKFSENCVVQALYSNYFGALRLKKVFNKPQDEFCKQFGYKNMEECTKNGVTISQLIDFLESHKIGYVGVDDNYNVIYRKSYSPSNHKIFCFMVGNQHLVSFINDNSAVVKAIFTQPTTSLESQGRNKLVQFDGIVVNTDKDQDKTDLIFDRDTFDQADFTIEHFNSLDSTGKTIYYTGKSYKDLLVACLKQGIPKPRVTADGTKISKIWWTKNHKIYLTKTDNYDVVKGYCKDNNLRFFGQSMAKAIVDKHLKQNEIDSCLITEELMDIFTNWSHNEKYFLLKHSENTKSIDLSRAYQNSLYNNSEPWCIFDGVKNVVECNKLHKTGLYYIEITNKEKEANLFFRTTKGWFYRHTVEYLIKNGFELTIKYFLEPSRNLEENYFKPIIDEIYTSRPKDVADISLYQDREPTDPDQLIEEHYKKADTLAKQTVRILSGILRSYKSNTSGKCSFGTKLSCLAYVKKYTDHKYSLTKITNDSEDDSRNVYFVSCWKPKIQVINSLPIGHQMLENSMVLLHQAYKLSTIPQDNIVAINCDEVIYDGNITIPAAPIVTLSNGHKGLLYNKNDQKTAYARWSKNSFINSTFTQIESYQIKQLSYTNITSDQKHYILEEIIKQKKNGLILGIAGTGKSYYIKHNFSKYVKLTFTKTAAKEINKDLGPDDVQAKTINKFFGMDYNGMVSRRVIRQCLKGVTGIVVDEVAQCNYHCYRILKLINMCNPNIHLVMFGDYDQTEPVKEENRDYQNTNLVKELANCHVVTLTECVRASDRQIVNVFREILDNKFFPQKQSTSKYIPTDINITVTNSARKQINKVHNTIKLRSYQGPTKVIEFTKLDKDDPRQDMTLFIGCKLICFDSFTLKDEFENEIGNCDKFIVESLDKTHAVLRDVDDNEQVTMSYTEIKNHLVLNYAITVNRAQGMTITEPYSIFEWDHPHNSNKKRYTAYSRCRDQSQIRIYS